MPAKREMNMGLLGGGNSGSEIDIAAEELDDLLRQVKSGIDGLSGMSGGERSTKLKNLKSSMTRAKNVLHSMKVELQDVEEREKAVFSKKISEYKSKYDGIHRELQAAGNASAKAELRDGASPRGDGNPHSNSEQMLDEAGKIQADDKKSTKRMLRQIEQTKELGADTMSTMKAQTEQITHIHQGLEEIDSTLGMAAQQIKQFSRKMATDKLIMGFLFLVVVGVITIIALKMFGVVGGDKVNFPDQPKDLV